MERVVSATLSLAGCAGQCGFPKAGPKPWRSSRTWQSLKPAARPQPNDIPAWWRLGRVPVLRLRPARLTCTAEVRRRLVLLASTARPCALPATAGGRAPSPPPRPGIVGWRCQASFFVNLPRLYSWCRRKPDMAINGRRNKPIGPGGSTRRLHHQGVSGQKPMIGRVLLMAGR